MTRIALDGELAAVGGLCRDLGLGVVTPTLLHAGHHTTLRLEPQGLVARVQSAEPLVGWARATREIAVTRYLTRRGAPVTAPCDGALAGPHLAGTAVVTLWPYLAAARPADDDDAVLAATTLAAVHHVLRAYNGDLPPYTTTLDRCWCELAEGTAAVGLARADQALLMAAFRRLRAVVGRATHRHVPLHGDAHPGNLLRVGGAGVWTDFEDACRGPREYDIACLPPDVWASFADADPALVAQCADLKSVCVAVWCAADPSRSPEVRAAAAYHLDRVRGFVA